MKKLINLFFISSLFLIAGCEDDEVVPDFNVVANAGPDQTVEVGDEVVLNGAGSVDESGEGLQIEWAFETRPGGSSASINNPGSITASFTPDVEGNYVVRLSVSNRHGSSTDQAVITAEAPVTGAVEIGGTVNDDTELEMVTPAGEPDYIVVSDIIFNADLVIRPGVIIEFRSNTGMRINENGSIKAVGTEQDSIILRGTVHEPGHWKGVRIDSNNPENELAYLAIRHGGQEGIGGTTSERARRGNLIIMSDNVRLKARNIVLSHGSGNGLYLHNASNTSLELSENRYTANNAPAYADVAMFHALDSESDYTGNVNDHIVSSDDRTLSNAVTWTALNVPYQLPGLIVEAALSIGAGTEFLVLHNKGVWVRGDGSFNAVGEESDPVVFRGLFDTRGHWNGIRITTNNPSNVIEHAVLRNGGQEGVGNLSSERNRRTSLMLDENARAEIRNVLITESQNYPFWIRGEGNLNIQFESNTITGNDFAGWLDARYFHVVDDSSDFQGNDTDRIASDADVTISQSRTWKGVNVPYALPQVTIDAGIITIEAGAAFEANTDGYLYVTGAGGIRMLGQENNNIVFRGQNAIPGAWRGIRVRTDNPDNKMSYVEIRHGGQNGIGLLSSERNRVTSLMLDESVRIAIDNLAIHDSREYAFWIRHSNNLNIQFQNNTFSGNEKLAMVDARYFHVLDGESSYSGNDEDIIRSETSTTASGNITWSRLDVPYELPDIVAVEGNLVIEAGARFHAAAHGGLDILETGSIIAVGTETDKIEFVGGISTPGHWRGINVRSTSSQNELSHFVISHTGSNGFGLLASDRNRRQAVQVWGGSLKLSNGHISHGTADGVRLHGGGTAELSEVTFESIDGENQVGF